jgi:hypothetical protein
LALVYPRYGDIGGAWAPSSAGGTREYLELEYKIPISLTGIDIFETYNGGCVCEKFQKSPPCSCLPVISLLPSSPFSSSPPPCSFPFSSSNSHKVCRIIVLSEDGGETIVFERPDNYVYYLFTERFPFF